MMKIPKRIPRIVRPIVEVKKPRCTRICKTCLPGLDLYCLATPSAREDGVARRGVARWAPPIPGIRTASELSEERFVLAIRRKMNVRVVHQHIYGNAVLQRDFHHGIVGNHFDVLPLRGNIEVLYNLENVVANLVLGIAVHDRKARLFLHLVGELVLVHVSRHDLPRRVNCQHHNDDNEDALQPAFAAFEAARVRLAWCADAFRIHSNPLSGRLAWPAGEERQPDISPCRLKLALRGKPVEKMAMVCFGKGTGGASQIRRVIARLSQASINRPGQKSRGSSQAGCSTHTSLCRLLAPAEYSASSRAFLP